MIVNYELVMLYNTPKCLYTFDGHVNVRNM